MLPLPLGAKQGSSSRGPARSLDALTQPVPAGTVGSQLPADLWSDAFGELLVISVQEETARRIESRLRNAGHPLRATWIAGLKDLQVALQRETPELVLCEKLTATAPIDKVVALCARIQPELPVVAISSSHSAADAVAAISAGAQDFVGYDDSLLLELVVVREIIRHHHLRDLRLTRQKLADFESRHHQLTEVTADPIAVVQEGIIVSANSAFVSLLGYDSAEALAGMPLIDLVSAESRAAMRERLRQVLQGKADAEPLDLALDGPRQKVRVKAQLILGRHEGESVIELLIRVDEGNRRPGPDLPVFLGRNQFAEALATAPLGQGASCAALLLRVDGFDGLERRIGHADAQEVTTLLSQLVGGHLEAQDRSFVFSIDELALLVQRPAYEPIEQLAARLRQEASNHLFAARHHEAHISVTVAVFPLGGEEPPAEIIRQLVEEARATSARGGNQVIALGETAKAKQAEREAAHTAQLVKAAIEENRLYLAYQAIASLEGESRNHYDVLVRMLDENGHELQAAEFLPAAQKRGLMPAIDRWVVSRVLEASAAESGKRGASLLFVKLSEDTLREAEGFIIWLRTRLGGRVLRSDEIVFQLQEAAIQNHVRKAKELCTALRELGASLAVEHFGIGANSSQLLAHFPADTVKFHHSFTRNFGDREVQKRLAALVEVARQQGLKTIVSHVEDAHVMARLWQMGVNFIQGYHARQPEVVSLQGEHATWRGDRTLPG